MLSETIHLVGDLLGRVLREQESVALFEVEERIRKAAKERRAGDPQAEAVLLKEVATLDFEEARVVAAAFALYFDLVNLAEENYRVDRLRARTREAYPFSPSGSIGEAVALLKRAGIGQAEMAELLSGLDIELVLTAHPTEAKRRTLLSKMARITRLLSAHHHADALPGEIDERERQLQGEIASFWLTARQRTTQPLKPGLPCISSKRFSGGSFRKFILTWMKPLPDITRA
jgi:phosphoenolpyruvate carboxylase